MRPTNLRTLMEIVGDDNDALVLNAGRWFPARMCRERRLRARSENPSGGGSGLQGRASSARGRPCDQVDQEN